MNESAVTFQNEGTLTQEQRKRGEKYGLFPIKGILHIIQVHAGLRDFIVGFRKAAAFFANNTYKNLT